MLNNTTVCGIFVCATWYDALVPYPLVASAVGKRMDANGKGLGGGGGKVSGIFVLYTHPGYGTQFIAGVMPSAQRNETEIKLKQNSFVSVLFQFHFFVRTADGIILRGQNVIDQRRSLGAGGPLRTERKTVKYSL